VAGTAVSQDELVKYLREHAPELAGVVERDLEKNFTAGDVHVPAAGGDGKKKKKTQATLMSALVDSKLLDSEETEKVATIRGRVTFDHRMKIDRVREKVSEGMAWPLAVAAVENEITLAHVFAGKDARKDMEHATFGETLYRYNPETATFDEAGSSDQAFDYWIKKISEGGDWIGGTLIPSLEKLKLKQKTSLEADAGELKALIAALNDNPTLRAALQQALTASVGKAALKTIRVIRHGATHLNDNDTSVDRVRGWKDVPLSEEGRKEATKLAEKMAKDCPDHIVCSDLKRAHDTAKLIASACSMKIDDVSKAFRPWNVGDYAGKTSKEAVPVLCRYAIEKPDEQIPGGEAFNSFRSRFFKGLADAVEKYPDGLLAVVTHHRGERLLTAWQSAGFPEDGTIDGKEFSKKGEGTAGYEDLEIPVDKLRAAANAKVTKWINAPEDFSKIFESGEFFVESDDTLSLNKLETVDKTVQLSIAKIDEAQQIFYGWAYVAEENGAIVVDKQDDYIMPPDLLKAAEDFTLHGGKLGDMHDARNVGRVVASFVTTKELKDAFGMKMAGDKVGWMLGFKVDDPAVWAKIRGGAQLELSIGGKGERVAEG
jgi:broad specificity phosphatase PhoE